MAGAALKQRHKVLPSVFDSSTGSTMTVLPWSMVRSISHQRSAAIEGDGVQLKKLPLKQFAPKGGVTNVGVLGITQYPRINGDRRRGNQEIWDETSPQTIKEMPTMPISIWQPIITCQMPYHAIPTDTKMTLHTVVHCRCFRYISCCEP